MDTSKFGFQPNIESMESYLKNDSQNQGDYDGPTWWSIPHGMSSVRILPPWDPTGRVALPVYMHPIEFQGKGMKYKKYNWTCVNKTCGKPCNICEGLASIAAAGVDISKYEANRRQFYFNAIVMYDPEFDKGIKAGKKPEDCDGVAPGTHVLMKSPKMVYDWVVSQITNPMVGDITSITNGIDIFITKEGSGLNTNYTATLSPDGRKPIPQEYLDKIESLYNPDEIFGTGFEADQINELVESLQRSSNVLNSGAVANVQNQMSGYQNSTYQQFGAPGTVPHNTGYPPMNNSVPAPPQFGGAPGFPTPNIPAAPSAPQFGQGIPSVPVNNNSPLPWNDSVPQAPVQQPQNQNVGGRPQCYGQYNPGSVQCVTCPQELGCQRDSRK